MNLFIVAFVCTTFLYSSVRADCSVCELNGYYTEKHGYQCIDLNNGQVLCTCPGGSYEPNKPCRICGRTNPAQDLCDKNNTKWRACLETDEFGTGYACACQDANGNEYFTTDRNCGSSPTLTPRPTTTTATIAGGGGGGPSICANGGALVNGLCQCPSGYGGATCADVNPYTLCDRVECKNNGTCAVRYVNGQYVSVCLCRYGFSGDFCELTGTLGYCSSGSCSNGGACRETVIGSTRHAYCHCRPGFSGPKCQTPYFTCPGVGFYTDQSMFAQGKYFVCTTAGATPQEQKSCAKGLRFSDTAQQCTY